MARPAEGAHHLTTLTSAARQSWAPLNNLRADTPAGQAWDRPHYSSVRTSMFVLLSLLGELLYVPLVAIGLPMERFR